MLKCTLSTLGEGFLKRDLSTYMKIPKALWCSSHEWTVYIAFARIINAKRVIFICCATYKAASRNGHARILPHFGKHHGFPHLVLFVQGVQSGEAPGPWCWWFSSNPEKEKCQTPNLSLSILLGVTWNLWMAAICKQVTLRTCAVMVQYWIITAHRGGNN